MTIFDTTSPIKLTPLSSRPEAHRLVTYWWLKLCKSHKMTHFSFTVTNYWLAVTSVLSPSAKLSKPATRVWVKKKKKSEYCEINFCMYLIQKVNLNLFLIQYIWSETFQAIIFVSIDNHGLQLMKIKKSSVSKILEFYIRPIKNEAFIIQTSCNCRNVHLSTQSGLLLHEIMQSSGVE